MPLEMSTGGRTARADAGRTAEIESVVGEARFQPQLAQPEIDLVEIDLAIADLHRAIQQRRAKGPRDPDVGGELAGCAIDVRHVQGDEVELRCVSVQLAPHRHIAPVGRAALGFEVTLDRANLAIFQLRLRIDHGARRGDAYRAGTERGVLHLVAQQFVRKLRVRELQSRSSLDRLIALLKRTGIDVDRAQVVH